MGRSRESGSVPPANFNPEEWLNFVETAQFARDWSGLGLTDDDLDALQRAIMVGAEHHPVVPGTNGLRKIRWADPKSGRGKSGSYRVCYVLFLDHGRVFLIAAFGKNEKSDLTKAERNAVAELIGRIKRELERESGS